MKTFVNGQLKQSVNTKDMVYSIAQLISIMSQGTTLEAGSIILSGSPPPLNRAADKEPFLKHGDDVRCYVEKCGSFHFLLSLNRSPYSHHLCDIRNAHQPCYRRKWTQSPGKALDHLTFSLENGKEKADY